MTGSGCIAWPVSTPAVTNIRGQAGNIHVPAEEGSVCHIVKGDYLKRVWAVSTLKKKKLNPCGSPAPDCKVYTFTIKRGTKRIAISRTNFIGAGIPFGGERHSSLWW
jgi:hypothetical protein